MPARYLLTQSLHHGTHACTPIWHHRACGGCGASEGHADGGLGRWRVKAQPPATGTQQEVRHHTPLPAAALTDQHAVETVRGAAGVDEAMATRPGRPLHFEGSAYEERTKSLTLR